MIQNWLSKPHDSTLETHESQEAHSAVFNCVKPSSVYLSASLPHLLLLLPLHSIPHTLYLSAAKILGAACGETRTGSARSPTREREARGRATHAVLDAVHVVDCTGKEIKVSVLCAR